MTSIRGPEGGLLSLPSIDHLSTYDGIHHFGVRDRILIHRPLARLLGGQASWEFIEHDRETIFQSSSIARLTSLESSLTPAGPLAAATPARASSNVE